MALDPIHASWVNQIEIWFSLLQRRVLQHADFPSAEDLRHAVLGFMAEWNRYEGAWPWGHRMSKRPSIAASSTPTARAAANPWTYGTQTT